MEVNRVDVGREAKGVEMNRRHLDPLDIDLVSPPIGLGPSQRMNSTYLLSSAISATHYAVVTQIENATSAAEVDAVCRRELDRLRHRLEKGKGRVKDVSLEP